MERKGAKKQFESGCSCFLSQKSSQALFTFKKENIEQTQSTKYLRPNVFSVCMNYDKRILRTRQTCTREVGVGEGCRKSQTKAIILVLVGIRLLKCICIPKTKNFGIYFYLHLYLKKKTTLK